MGQWVCPRLRRQQRMSRKHSGQREAFKGKIQKCPGWKPQKPKAGTPGGSSLEQLDNSQTSCRPHVGLGTPALSLQLVEGTARLAQQSRPSFPRSLQSQPTEGFFTQLRGARSHSRGMWWGMEIPASPHPLLSATCTLGSVSWAPAKAVSEGQPLQQLTGLMAPGELPGAGTVLSWTLLTPGRPPSGGGTVPPIFQERKLKPREVK